MDVRRFTNMLKLFLPDGRGERGGFLRMGDDWRWYSFAVRDNAITQPEKHR